MSRDWYVVYSNIIIKPKYRRLSPATRGALFHIFALAGFQDPEASWPSHSDLEQSLELDGWDGGSEHFGTPDGKTVVSDLIEWGWLDVDDEGRLWIHDWDRYQRAVTEKVRTAYERERKAAWRLRKREQEPPLPKNPLPERRDNRVDDITVSRDVRDSPGQPVSADAEVAIAFDSDDDQRRGAPLLDERRWDPAWDEFLKAWVQRGFTTNVITDATKESLWSVIDAYPSMVAQWVREAPAGASPYKVIGCVFKGANEFRKTTSRAAA